MSYQFAKINGVKIHYQVKGEGEPLVLIHAAIANLNMWDAQMKPFTPFFRVLRYDVRGFGETPDPAGSYKDYEDLKALLDHLDIPRAHILGISNGGRIALDFALTYPQMVNKLVLIAPGLPGFRAPEDKFEVEMSAKYDAAIKEGDNRMAADIIAQTWLDGPRRKPNQVDPDFRQRALGLIRHTIDLGIGAGEGEIARPPAGERLGEVKAPTLLILGEEDLQSMHHIVEKIEQDIPHVTRTNMPGTAHLPPMEKSEKFNRIVLDFLGN
ncbi:MAG: alpha/beta hydrolase [Anaerolineales bacterium]